MLEQLGQSYRLSGEAQYTRIFDGRARVKGRLWIVQFSLRLNNSSRQDMLTAATNTKKHQVTPAPAHARMGFAIAKKLVKRAVGRNYLKRVAREVFRKHTLKHEQVDLVVRLNPEAKPANTRFIPDNFSNLEQDLVAAFNAVRATALKPMVL